MIIQTRPCANAQLRESRISILSFHMRVAGPEHVIDLVKQLFPQTSCWAAGSDSGLASQIKIMQVRDDGDAWHILKDDVVVRAARNLSELATVLEWMINSEAVESLASDHLLFHSGAVALGKTGIILPARSGSGKSTLTAALIADGFTYFSDEVAVISPESGCLLPFAKSIKVKTGSMPALASRYPDLIDADIVREPSGRRATYLQPPDSAWPSRPVPLRYVVFPRYVAGAETRLEALSRSEGFARLLAHSFNAGGQAASGVRRIIQLLEQCECYHLTVGEVSDAVAQLRGLACTPHSEIRPARRNDSTAS